MSARAQLAVTEQRRASRHPVDYTTIAEHRQLGDFDIRIANISPQGFMIQGEYGLARGDRIVVRLPIVGRIEAYVMWTHEGRAGLQTERVIRADELAELAIILQSKAPTKVKG